MTITPLKINALNKSYEGKSVLENITFSLQEGEIFGLIGLNGAGKTTLIKIILDLCPADSGSAEMFGVSSQKPSARENVIFVPEKFQPSPHFTGMEYIKLTLEYFKKTVDMDEAKQLAEKLHLEPAALHRRIRTYSKGMGQKLGLITAHLADRPLMILDEPMSGLDPSARIDFKTLLLDAKKAGKTLFFSSHILADIDEICDRIAIIHNGKLSFVGTPSELKMRIGNTSLEKTFLQLIQSEAA